ncbi:MAG: hypothetical protein M1429_02105 [Patescibacteria group bacterium]|nr:hypothetical protein [Patescibacteria group bacterium]
MKQTTILLFILYFLILAGGVTAFYLKYVRNYTPVATQTLQVETVNLRPLIYYTKTNILSSVDPDPQNKISTTITLEAQGEIGQLDLNKPKSQFAYEQKNANSNWEIWQGDSSNLQKEKVGFIDQTKFGNFQDFSKPKYSPDMTKLAFLAQGSTTDTIFVENLATGVLQKIINDSAVKITDYSWDKASKKLIYCSSNPPAGQSKNACFSVTQEGQENTLVFEREVKKISWDKTDNIFYLSRDDIPHIYTVSPGNQDHTQIDDVTAPKKIVGFQINPDGKKIVYEIIADQKSDLYLSDTTGANRFQLTNDDNASQPIFSDTAIEKIAFLRQKDGIYTINLDQTNVQKVVSLKDTINSLLLWK